MPIRLNPNEMKGWFSEKTTAIPHFQFRAIFRRCDAYGGKKERKKRKVQRELKK